MLDVSLTSLVIDENIVQIALYEIVEEISQNVVHVMLIIGWAIGESEWQDFEFI